MAWDLLHRPVLVDNMTPQKLYDAHECFAEIIKFASARAAAAFDEIVDRARL
jgi:hypothetical protein